MIETKRLMLIPFTLDYVKAAIKGKKELEAILQYQVAEQWPNQDYAEILPFIASKLEKDPSKSKWSFIVMHKEDQKLIGEIGGKGGPNENGTIEIGYGIVEEYRNKGFATEMVKGLVNWLNTLPEVHKIIAECLLENLPSIIVLEKSGFIRTHQDDDLMYWEYKE